MAKRGWSWFTGHGLYAYYLTCGWASLLPDPLACGAGSNSSHQGTVVYGWMPNCFGGGAHKQEMRYSAMMLIALLHVKFLSVATPEEGSENETGMEGGRKWGKEKK